MGYGRSVVFLFFFNEFRSSSQGRVTIANATMRKIARLVGSVYCDARDEDAASMITRFRNYWGRYTSQESLKTPAIPAKRQQ